jgi:hypothetical protein
VAFAAASCPAITPRDAGHLRMGLASKLKPVPGSYCLNKSDAHFNAPANTASCDASLDAKRTVPLIGLASPGKPMANPV